MFLKTTAHAADNKNNGITIYHLSGKTLLKPSEAKAINPHHDINIRKIYKIVFILKVIVIPNIEKYV